MAGPMECRTLFGDRTYESGRKLFDGSAVRFVERKGKTLWLYVVKDRSEFNVAVWDRKGRISV